MSYQPGIPTGLIPLDQDYLNIQGNFSQLNSVFNQDHSPLTGTLPPVGSAGYHTNIHLVRNSTTISNPPNNQPVAQPTSTPGYGIIWNAQTTDGLDTDETLYYLTGGGKNIQLTRNVLPKAAANGYTFLPGGILYQWGVTGATSAASINVLFATANKDFPFNCWNVIAIPIRAATSPGSDFSCSIVSISTTGFTIGNIGAHSVNGFYWTAIGN